MTESTARGGLPILAFAVFGAILTEVVPIGLVPEIVRAFGVSEDTAGLLIGVYAAVVALSAVVLTRWTRRVARRPLLLATLAVFTISNVLAAAAPGFEVLVAARGLGGLAHALFFAIAIGYAARIAREGQIGRALSTMSTGTAAGLILGVPAGAALGEFVGWRGTFAVLAVITALGALGARALLPPVTHDAAAGRTLVPGGARTLFVAALSGAAFLGYYMLYSYVSPMLLAAGTPREVLPIVLIALGVSGLVGIRIAAPRLDRRPYAWMLGVPIAIGLTQLALSLVFPALIATIVVALVWTACFGPVNSTYQATLVRIGRANPEMAAAWSNVACNIGIAGGSALGGALVVGPGYPAAGIAGTLVLATAAVLTLVARPALTRPAA